MEIQHPEYIDRFKRVLGMLGKNKRELAGVLGMTEQQFSRYANGYRLLPLDKVGALLEAAPSLNARWFITGEGDPEGTDVASGALSEGVVEIVEHLGVIRGRLRARQEEGEAPVGGYRELIEALSGVAPEARKEIINGALALAAKKRTPARGAKKARSKAR